MELFTLVAVSPPPPPYPQLFQAMFQTKPPVNNDYWRGSKLCAELFILAFRYHDELAASGLIIGGTED